MFLVRLSIQNCQQNFWENLDDTLEQFPEHLVYVYQLININFLNLVECFNFVGLEVNLLELG